MMVAWNHYYSDSKRTIGSLDVVQLTTSIEGESFSFTCTSGMFLPQIYTIIYLPHQYLNIVGSGITFWS